MQPLAPARLGVHSLDSVFNGVHVGGCARRVEVADERPKHGDLHDAREDEERPDADARGAFVRSEPWGKHRL